MSSPQTEDGYTRIANELFEAILEFGFTQRQLHVVLAVIRKTYGYGKKTDDMSASQIGAICRMQRSHVTEVIGQLVAMNVLTRSNGSYGLVLGVNKAYGEWIEPPEKAGKETSTKPKRRQDGEQSHYVYKVTHQHTGEFYIGVRSCLCNPNQDRYKGSGGWLATVKFADLDKEIMMIFSSLEDAEQAMESLIRKEIENGLLRNTKEHEKNVDSTESVLGGCPDSVQGGGVQNLGFASTESVQVDSTESVHTKENLLKQNQKKASRQEITFKKWIETCQSGGIDPIPEDDPVFDYADHVGLPIDFIRMTWIEFKRKYSAGSKRYKNWNQHFQNAVRENWYKIWFDKDGAWMLTTRGKQIELELKARKA